MWFIVLKIAHSDMVRRSLAAKDKRKLEASTRLKVKQSRVSLQLSVYLNNTITLITKGHMRSSLLKKEVHCS